MKIAFILLLILVFIVLSLKKLNIVSLSFLLSMLLFIVYLDSVFPLLRFELKGDEVTMIPDEMTTLEGEDKENFDKLLSMLDEVEDVQKVYHNVNL